MKDFQTADWRTSCAACSGSGNCPRCRGLGEIACGSCDGLGCPQCLFDGREMCPRCALSGACRDCDGLGQTNLLLPLTVGGVSGSALN